VQQASSVLLAAVAALSLLNVAGGADAAPAAMADLLRSPELKDQLDKREWQDRPGTLHLAAIGVQDSRQALMSVAGATAVLSATWQLKASMWHK
jgi:hypothetical protein